MTMTESNDLLAPSWRGLGWGVAALLLATLASGCACSGCAREEAAPSTPPPWTITDVEGRFQLVSHLVTQGSCEPQEAAAVSSAERGAMVRFSQAVREPEAPPALTYEVCTSPE